MALEPPPNATLLSLDIFEQIFSCFALGLDDSEVQRKIARRELLKLALLSRATTGPALSALWRSMDSLLPLLLLIPQFKLRQGQYVFCPDRSPVSWTRFDFYASRIRAFKYRPPEVSSTPINLATYGCIARLRGQGALPSLQTLFIDLDDCSASPLHDLEILVTSMLTGSSLRNIKIRNWNERITIQFDIFPLISTLLLLGDGTNSIEISGYISTAVLGFIYTHPNLRRLNLRLSTADANSTRSTPHELPYLLFLQGLCRATELRELTMNLFKSNYDYSSLQLSRFSSLRRLSLTGDVTSLVTFVGQISTPVLMELDVEMRCSLMQCQHSAQGGDVLQTSHRIDSLISQISEKWQESMTSLRIQVICNAMASQTALEGFLVPIACLTNLQSLEFTVAMARAPKLCFSASKVMQHLTRLRKLRFLYLPHTCRASLRDIHYLAFHLPILRHLRVTIGLDVTTAFSNPIHPLRHRLETLDVYESSPLPADDLVELNWILWQIHSIFPYLSSLERTHSPTWSRAMGLIKLIQYMEKRVVETSGSSVSLSLPPIWTEPLPNVPTVNQSVPPLHLAPSSNAGGTSNSPSFTLSAAKQQRKKTEKPTNVYVRARGNTPVVNAINVGSSSSFPRGWISSFVDDVVDDDYDDYDS